MRDTQICGISKEHAHGWRQHKAYLYQWFPNVFLSRTICGTRTVTMYHLAPGKLHLPNIIRSKVWKTGIDTNAT